MSLLGGFHLPISWTALVRRTWNEVLADNCLGLAAQLAYYFFLALFPALLFMVALISFLPFGDVLSTMMTTLGRVAPGEVLAIMTDQLAKVAASDSGGLLTIGAAGALWSTSAGVAAIMDTLNQAYDIRESRPWWKVRLIAMALTVALAVFMVLAFVLVVAGPALAHRVADWFGLGALFTWTWLIIQWPVVFLLVVLAVAIVYYYGPDAEQEWEWITPGSLLATLLWLLVSLGFRFYVTNFGSYNATYGAIGGVIVLMLWFYFSGLALLVGAELNAEAEHASPYGKDPGEKKPGERKAIGRLAERLWRRRHAGAGQATVPAIAMSTTPEALGEANCALERELPPPPPAPPGDVAAAVPVPAAPAGTPPSPQPGRPVRPSEVVLGGLVLAPAMVLTYLRLRPRLRNVRS